MDVQLVSYRDTEAAKKFTDSLRDTGFAVLTDHPISASLIKDAFRDWEQFFESDAKNQYTFDPRKQSGFFPFKTEQAKDSKVKDLKEFFHFFAWSELPREVGNSTLELFERLNGLAIELLTWVEEATPLEIRETFSCPLREMVNGSRDTLLRPIHYPPLKGDEEEGAIRAAAHEDINLITLLPAANQPGLEVLDSKGRWHSVSCDPGQIAINAGDMLQMASKGYYRSTTHRVVNPQGMNAGLPRYSMPLFLHPRPDVVLSPQHTAESYLKERLTQIGLLKTAPAQAPQAPLENSAQL